VPSVRSVSRLVTCGERESGWGARIARQIDDAVVALTTDQDVITVSVMPFVDTLQGAGMYGSLTWTSGAIITVVWREPTD
jgi:hypothetical protein